MVLFLLPLLTVPPPGSEAAAEELPTGTLPIHRAVQTASGERDKSRMVKLQQADGTVAELSCPTTCSGWWRRRCPPPLRRRP